MLRQNQYSSLDGVVSYGTIRMAESKLDVAEKSESVAMLADSEAGISLENIAPVTIEKVRKLGAFAVAILSFAAVAGGPYGIEAAVGAAGPLPVIIGCIFLAFAWSCTY